mgnify:CR=1 FL=1
MWKTRWQLGGRLTSQLGNVLARLRELVQRVACPQRDERVQLRIIGGEVRIGDSCDIVGVDGLGFRFELLHRFDGIVLCDGSRRFGVCGRPGDGRGL